MVDGGCWLLDTGYWLGWMLDAGGQEFNAVFYFSLLNINFMAVLHGSQFDGLSGRIGT